MAKRAVEIADLYRMKLVNEPDVDPSGHVVVFSVTTLDREDNRYRSQLWLHDLRTGEQRAMTSGECRDTQPRWSPDGRRIAFVSDRKTNDVPAGQLWVISASGGEARRLTSHAHAVESYDWSPMSDRIAFVANTNVPLSDASCRDSDIKVITTPRFRADGAGFLGDKFKQVFVIDVESGVQSQLTEGRFDHVQATWSPTGFEIACVANRDDGWEFSWVRDVYVISVATGALRRLTDGAGSWSLPAWSPDGTRIACYGTRRLDSPRPRSEVFVVSSTGSGLRSVTAEHDIDFRDASIADWVAYDSCPPHWIDDTMIAAIASVHGEVRLARVDILSGRFELLGESGGRIGAPCLIQDGGYVVAATDFCNPGELYRLSAVGEREQLTSFNDGWRDEVELSAPEPLIVESPDGEMVHGWLLRPPSIDDEQRVPLLLEIHGGPFGMYADTFMHEFHLLAAQGYAILFTNPRGSAGYGDRLADLLGRDWGENDMPDLMAAVDHAVSLPYIDGARLGVLGGSYGGFMTNWVIGHTGRFRAAVTQRTLSDLYSAWGTDDIFFSDQNTTFGAAPWQAPDRYFHLSPISYVEHMTTPLLISQSEEDYRCPMGQAEQLFIALKRLGRTVELVRFPDESHGLSRSGQPRHREERLRHILRWFDTHL
jgi:dipeptidyl aminopeptidase/acylaminoacyl peptidase